MENNKELIQQYKEELLQNIRNEILQEGSVNTYIQVMGTKKDSEKPVIVHIDASFGDDEDKEYFLEEGIPHICKKLKKHDFEPVCVVFVAEAWMKIKDLKEDKKEEKKEVVIVNFSASDGDVLHAYPIIRHPYEIDSAGELTSRVELSEDELTKEEGKPQSAGGKFTNLYHKFYSGLCN